MNINKFTQKSIEAVNQCEKIAYDHGHQEIDQEHFLYSLLTIDDSLIASLLEKMGINKETFLSYIKTKSIWTQEDLMQTLENDGTKYSIVALSTCSIKQVDDRTVVLAMYQK